MVDVSAVLFDVDGTLVDSNYLHVYAWTRAFGEAGITVESWRIHRSIGMDGAKLIKSLSGDADDDAQKQAEELHTRYLKEAAPLLRPLSWRARTSTAGSLARSAGRAGQLCG
jgi:beta-phosphoglucomutase-like phosphatase (HAD superfamily)